MTVALGARTAEEFSHTRAGPAPALTGRDAICNKMIGVGLKRGCSHRFRSLNFNDDTLYERLNLYSTICHS